MYVAPPSVHMLIYSNAFTPSSLFNSSTILGTSKIPAILIPQRHTNTPTVGLTVV
ncbi:MAG: hypothetical protein ACTSUN_10920 [Promethearchaeota archaeon]